MTVCVRTLYRVFPEIKAFGFCHGVGTQHFLTNVVRESGIGEVKRQDIKVNVVGINHFTWLTKAQYKNIDLFPIYRDYCLSHKNSVKADENWMNRLLNQRKWNIKILPGRCGIYF